MFLINRMAKVLSTQLCVSKWVFILLLAYKLGSQPSGLLIFQHLNSILPTPTFGPVLHSQHLFCSQLQNPSHAMYAPGDPSTFGKNKLYPNIWLSCCYFHHFALNYASLSAPASMPRCNLSIIGSPSLNPTCQQGLTSDFCLCYSLSYSWTDMTEVGEPHTSPSKQLYLPHCFLYSSMFMLCTRPLLPLYDPCPMPHPSHIPTQHC